nr:MAG TPA: hypothetical protein [Caudoviricetes sp.]
MRKNKNPPGVKNFEVKKSNGKPVDGSTPQIY